MTAVRNNWLLPFTQRIFIVRDTSVISQIAKRSFASGWTNDSVKINPFFLRQNIQQQLEPKMDSYGKLSAECYGVWFPEDQEYEDAPLFRKYIQNSGKPALEIGCGDGRLLIPFVSEGLEVEGVDLSPFMIQNCKNKAAKKGVSVTLYEQSMQELNIPKQYGTIYIPYGSFMLVSDPQESLEAIKRFYNHLLPDGHLMVSLFIPTECDVLVPAAKQNEWRLRREGVLPDGNLVRVWEKPFFDIQQQIECAEYRYEVLSDGQIISTEFEHLKMRWYTQPQFTEILKQAGFSSVTCLKGSSDLQASPEEGEFTVVAKKQ